MYGRAARMPRLMALEFSPVRTRRTFEEAVDQIAERIKLGDLRPGDRLPSERELAAQMQISRPTVREALKVLQESGVIEVRPGSGGGAFVVDDRIPAELVDRQEMRVGEVAGVLEARRLLEPRVAQLASLYATEDDFDVMRRAIDEQRVIAARPGFLDHEDRFLQLDLQFHLAIARATRNTTVVELVRQLLRKLEIARDLALHVELVPDWTIDVHERTLSAIRSGDPERIESVMDEHLGKVERLWEEHSGRALVRRLPDFLRPVADRGT
jgi:GntR family transcriptional regulator, transcriptional repressor for pyruvate dehydrogenase complex